MPHHQNAIVHDGVEIGMSGDMLNLTAMWKAAGANRNRRPMDWRRHEGADFVAEISKDGVTPHIWQSRGRAGTWAHWQIGLAYAAYLSPAMHAEINRVYRAYLEGEIAPVGSTGWQVVRDEAKDARKDYASEFFSRGGTPKGMGRATNAGYVGCFGKDTAGLRRELGVKGRKTPRDRMTRVQLAQVRLYEELSREDFEYLNARGDDECVAITAQNARHVGNAVADARSNRRIA